MLSNKARLLFTVFFILTTLIFGSIFPILKSPSLTSASDSTLWVQTGGPMGGLITTIEIDPSHPDTIYCGGIGGSVFKTTNGGAEWTMLDQIVEPDRMIMDILISPQDPETIYAQTHLLHKSTDGGETWRQLRDLRELTCIAMSRENPLVLITGSWYGDVYYSVDGGEKWENIAGDLPGERIADIAIGDAGEFWVGTANSNNGHLYHTLNKGASWEMVNIDQRAETDIRTVFVDPEDNDIVYVGLVDVHNEKLDPKENGYLLKTEDGGKTWTSLHLPNTDAMIDIMGRSPADNFLYVGTGGVFVFRSDDGGQNWERVEVPGRNGDMYDVAVDPRNSRTIYLPRRAYGIIKSIDRGMNWTLINEGLYNVTVNLLAVPEIPGGTVYATTTKGEGTFKTVDFGNSWENVNKGGITHPWADEIKVSPLDPEVVWEIADVGQVFITSDGGETWNRVFNPGQGGNGFRFGSVTAIATAPSDDDTIYALKNGFGIFKTTEGSQRNTPWQFLHQSEVDYTYSIAVHPKNPDIVISGYNPKPFQDWAVVRRSNDGGGTWETVLEVPKSSGVTSVAFDPSNPDMVYAGSAGEGGAIWMSEDGGYSWHRLNASLDFTNIHVMSVDPNDSLVAYAGVWGGGTFKTSDGGQSWSRLPNDPTISASAILIDPRDSNIVYIADRTKPRIYRTTDGGNHWEVYFDAGAGYYRVIAASLVPGNPDILYASIFSHTGPESPMAGDTFRLQQGTAEKLSGALLRLPVALTVDSNDEKTVYAVLHGYGVYRTTDAGENWTELSITGSGLPVSPAPGFNGLVIDPEDNNILYLLGGCDVDTNLQHTGVKAELMNTVYRSTDRGTTWTNLNDGTLGENSGQVKGLAIAPDDSDTLYIGTSNGIFLSIDGGSSWTNISSGLSYTTIAGVALSDNGNYLYAPTLGGGIFVGKVDRNTGKVTWDNTSNLNAHIYNVKVMVHPSDSNTIFASAYPGGTFKSTNRGETWAECNFGMASFKIDDPNRQGYYAFDVSLSDPEVLYLGIYGVGFYKSADGGGTWMPANGKSGTMRGRHITALIIDPAIASKVYVAAEEGIYMTNDGGITWSDFSSGLDSTQVRTLSMTANGTLLAGTLGYELFAYDKPTNRWRQMRAFSNFGTFWPIWNDRPLYQYTSLLFHPTDSNIIYFGTFPAGIYKSTDGGEHWLENNVGWTNDGVFTIVFHPRDTEIIFAGTYNGLNLSTDAGAHWETCNEGWPVEQWVFSIDFDPRNPDIMYACSKNGENEGVGREGFHGIVMKSIDGGQHWFSITNGLDVNQEFYNIIVDSHAPDILYLASERDGVFISRNGGDSWSPWNEGLTNVKAGTNGNNVTNTMVLSADGLYLYFGTAGSGVLRRPTITNDHPAILVSPSSWNISSLKVGSLPTSQVFNIINTGTVELTVENIAIIGPDASEFSIQNDNCSGQTIAPLEARTLEVTFSPASPGSKSAVLVVPSNDPNSLASDISLMGEVLYEDTSDESMPEITTTPTPSPKPVPTPSPSLTPKPAPEPIPSPIPMPVPTKETESSIAWWIWLTLGLVAGGASVALIWLLQRHRS